MPAFKPKATKKIVNNTKNNVTVDSKHQEMMDDFNKTINSIIPALIKKKEAIEMKLQGNLNIEEKLDLEDQLKIIKKTIKKKKKEKKEYLLNNANLIGIVYKHMSRILSGQFGPSRVR